MCRSLTCAAVIVILLMGLVGCQLFTTMRGADVSSTTAAEELYYREGITLYRQGKYAVAAQRFENLRLMTDDQKLRCMALYGLACARLMAADTTAAYRQAMHLWNAWSDCATVNFDSESPLLIVPLIKEKTYFGKLPLTGMTTDGIKDDKVVPVWKLSQTMRELETLRQQLDQAEREKKNAHKMNAMLEKEVEELKEQIKALEAIDQKIQEKKSAIPSAD